MSALSGNGPWTPAKQGVQGDVFWQKLQKPSGLGRKVKLQRQNWKVGYDCISGQSAWKAQGRKAGSGHWVAKWWLQMGIQLSSIHQFACILPSDQLLSITVDSVVKGHPVYLKPRQTATDTHGGRHYRCPSISLCLTLSVHSSPTAHFQHLHYLPEAFCGHQSLISPQTLPVGMDRKSMPPGTSPPSMTD